MATMTRSKLIFLLDSKEYSRNKSEANRLFKYQEKFKINLSTTAIITVNSDDF